jgi:elongation factor 1-alpha
MTWWTGVDVEVGTEKVHVDTIYDVLDKMCRVPERPTTAPMRMPISGIYKIKGVGDVLAGRVEQGVVKPGEEASSNHATVLHVTLAVNSRVYALA